MIDRENADPALGFLAVDRGNIAVLEPSKSYTLDLDNAGAGLVDEIVSLDFFVAVGVGGRWIVVEIGIAVEHGRIVCLKAAEGLERGRARDVDFRGDVRDLDSVLIRGKLHHRSDLPADLWVISEYQRIPVCLAQQQT